MGVSILVAPLFTACLDGKPQMPKTFEGTYQGNNVTIMEGNYRQIVLEDKEGHVSSIRDNYKNNRFIARYEFHLTTPHKKYLSADSVQKIVAHVKFQNIPLSYWNKLFPFPVDSVRKDSWGQLHGYTDTNGDGKPDLYQFMGISPGAYVAYFTKEAAAQHHFQIISEDSRENLIK